MRKFIIIIAFIVCFIVTGFCKYDVVNFAFNQSANPKYYFYVSLNTETNDSHYTKNGNGGIIKLDKDELYLLNSFDIEKIYGTSIELECNEKEYDLLLDKMVIDILKCENFENFTTIYGYSAKYGKCVTIGGNKVNVQIAKRDDRVYIGFPILLGSY